MDFTRSALIVTSASGELMFASLLEDCDVEGNIKASICGVVTSPKGSSEISKLALVVRTH